MKKLKLITHSTSHLPQDVFFNQKDLPEVVNGDILSIRHYAQNVNEILVQVSDLESNSSRTCEANTISISEFLIGKWDLKKWREVEVSVVDGHGIELVELIFRKQYYSRADMWRMRSSLLKKLIYLDQEVELLGMKAKVGEIWYNGKGATCGVVIESTRVTFRSASAQVSIFIQMSQEMWSFDNYGDLYFERAVDGFLTNLFKLWNDKSCCHDASITLFSRNFYNAQSLDDFPDCMKLCVQKDCEGRFYEDFYRVVVQNERYNDWTLTLQKLKQIFNTYENDVVQFHHKIPASEDKPTTKEINDRIKKIPEAVNSSASEGNVLEVMNMSLNIFEKFHLDRSFDRTGKLLIIITPGNGVFDVNRQLINITKQRIIDCGGCCDLVCLATQPIFISSLFRFTNSKNEYNDNMEDFALAYWMNSSFYISKAEQMTSERVKYVNLNTDLLEAIEKAKIATKKESEQQTLRPVGFLFIKDMPIVNFDQHDQNVFKKKSKNVTNYYQNKNRRENGALKTELRPRHRPTISVEQMYCNDSNQLENPVEPFLSSSFDVNTNDSILQSKLQRQALSLTVPFIHHRRPTAKNETLNMCKAPSLINPFAPTKLPAKVTSNRRRWSHAHLTNTSLLQQHNTSSSSSTRHTSAVSPLIDFPRTNRISECNSESSFKPASFELPKYLLGEPLHITNSYSNLGSLSDVYSSSFGRCRTLSSRPNLLPLPSIISEGSISQLSIPPELPIQVTRQEFDWKSMTKPALLPTTTDYFPTLEILNSLFLVSSYMVTVEEKEAQRSIVYGLRKSPTIKQTFDEMIFLRLAQGFQIVVQVKSDFKPSIVPTPKLSIISRLPVLLEEVKMSIGRVFHRLTLERSSITVETFRPKHPLHNDNLDNYTYRFMVPDSKYFDSSWTKFVITKPESYPWNYVDHHLLTRGEENDTHRVDAQKFWRARFFLLPIACKKMSDYHYEQLADAERKQLIENFLKFAEFVNRMKKLMQSMRRPRDSARRGSIVAPDKSLKSLKMEGPAKPPPSGVHHTLSPTKSHDGSLSGETSYLLSPKASSADIVSCMMDVNEGFSFLSTQQEYVTLPTNCFSSHDAVTWLHSNMATVRTVSDAIDIMQKLINEGLVCHASGRTEVPFTFGFFLYYFVTERSISEMSQNIGTSVLQNCMEVEVVPERNKLNWDDGDLEEKIKIIRMDLDSKTQREEWGVIEYQKQYSPDLAYRFSIQWLVATGSIIGEQVIKYISKAKQYGFKLLPAPIDAFALPFTPNSDPLRGPIYIRLDVNHLMPQLSLEETTLFQDSIVRSFGFVLDHCSGSSVVQARQFKRLIQYIHITGGMFVMLVTLDMTAPSTKQFTHSHSQQSMQEEYEKFVLKQATNKHNDSNISTSCQTVGFLWSWNFMLTKSCMESTSDGLLQDNMLKEFKLFCSNQDNKLINFWNNYKTKLGAPLNI